MDCHCKTPLDAALYTESVLEELTYRPQLQVIDANGEITEFDLEDYDPTED